jgi:hypothetical protein
MPQTAETDLARRVAEARPQSLALLAALQAQIDKFNVDGDTTVIPAFEAAQCTLEYDQYNGQHTLMASFYKSPRYRNGVLLFHCDGSCYGEFLIMCPHPARPGMFIEAIEAWVVDGEIKTDARMAMMPVPDNRPG